MVSKTAIRVGVLLVVVLGSVAMTSDFAAASDHCEEETDEEWPSECPDEGDEDPFYDGPSPDLVGNVTDTVGQLLNPAELQSR